MLVSWEYTADLLLHIHFNLSFWSTDNVLATLCTQKKNLKSLYLNNNPVSVILISRSMCLKNSLSGSQCWKIHNKKKFFMLKYDTPLGQSCSYKFLEFVVFMLLFLDGDGICCCWLLNVLTLSLLFSSGM